MSRLSQVASAHIADLLLGVYHCKGGRIQLAKSVAYTLSWAEGWVQSGQSLLGRQQAVWDDVEARD